MFLDIYPIDRIAASDSGSPISCALTSWTNLLMKTFTSFVPTISIVSHVFWVSMIQQLALARGLLKMDVILVLPSQRRCHRLGCRGQLQKTFGNVHV